MDKRKEKQLGYIGIGLFIGLMLPIKDLNLIDNFALNGAVAGLIAALLTAVVLLLIHKLKIAFQILISVTIFLSFAIGVTQYIKTSNQAFKSLSIDGNLLGGSWYLKGYMEQPSLIFKTKDTLQLSLDNGYTSFNYSIKNNIIEFSEQEEGEFEWEIKKLNKDTLIIDEYGEELTFVKGMY